mmetsp:Transcript_26655/g.79512  ORF Transcript_26655/g.79512 Transcript_26655/m.79512 type:complete len:201 (-) Transcript_26655:634-1236(-)
MRVHGHGAQNREADREVCRGRHVLPDLLLGEVVERLRVSEPLDHAAFDQLPIAIKGLFGDWVHVAHLAAIALRVPKGEVLELLVQLGEGSRVPSNSSIGERDRGQQAEDPNRRLAVGLGHRLLLVRHDRWAASDEQAVGDKLVEHAAKEQFRAQVSVHGRHQLEAYLPSACVLQLQEGRELEDAPQPREIRGIPQNYQIT